MNRVHGFTLIELMIVMIIMGILAAIGVTAFISSQIKGRDTARKGNLNAISQVLELYYNDNGRYPADDGLGGIKGCGGGIGVVPVPPPTLCPAGGSIKDAKGTIYMPLIPKDPVSPKQQYWYSSQAGTQYQLYAHLENSQDLQIMTPAPAWGLPSCGGTGAACNYGVSSPNANP